MLLSKAGQGVYGFIRRRKPQDDLATTIDTADVKTVLANADTFVLTEPTTLKKTLWSTIKNTLITLADTLYLKLTGGTITGGLTINGNLIVDGSSTTTTLNVCNNNQVICSDNEIITI